MSIKEGFLLINKPSGLTSHDIVDRIRKITGVKKVGHAGTLDPFAKGLLIILIGRSFTKKQANFLEKDKEYLTVLHLGKETDTFDKTGEITKETLSSLPQENQIKEALKQFKGEILQTPPQFSAKKINGQAAYKLVRQHKKVSLKSVKITIKKIDFLKYQPPYLTLRILCSKGTYIRGIARDLGRQLGCGAYVDQLTRTSSGHLTLQKAISLHKLNKNNWQDYLKQA